MNLAQIVGVIVIGLILAAWSGCNGCGAKKAVDTANTAVATAGSANDKAEEAKKKAVEFEDWRKKKLFPWSPEFKGAEEVLENHDKEIKELKKRPATVVTVTSATVTPAPAPAKWNLEDLLNDFQSADRATAELAAKRLAAEGKGSEALVKLFSETSSEVTKNRVVWSLRYWAGEPARKYLLDVHTDPAPHRASIVSAVGEIVKRIDALNTPAKNGKPGANGEKGRKG